MKIQTLTERVLSASRGQASQLEDDMRRLVLAVLFIALFGRVSLSSLAQSSGVPLTHFQHTAWTLQNGAPSEINVLAQTRDGYLWLGTANGLFRFDGVSFERYQLPHGQTFLSSAIMSLLATKDGGLWIGYTLGGMSFLKDGILRSQKPHLTHGRGSVFSFYVDDDGSVWAGTYSGLAHFYGGIWHDAEENEDIGGKATYLLHRDRDGALWVGTDDFMYRRAPGSKHFASTGIKPGPVALFANGPDGALWILDGDGVLRAKDWQPQKKRILYAEMYNDSPFDMLFDNTGALWVLGAKTGVTRIPRPVTALHLKSQTQPELEHFTARDGLTSDRAFAALKDREGNMWVATPDGLDRFRMSVFNPAPLPSTFGEYALVARPDGSLLVGTERDGLQALVRGKVSKRTDVKMTYVSCVYPTSDGKLWIGGEGELGYLKDNHFVRTPFPVQKKSLMRDIEAMTTGPDGDLWVQIDGMLPIMSLHDGKWTEIAGSNTGIGPALVLTTDHHGRVWAGHLSGVVVRFDGNHGTRIDRSQGLTIGNVTAIYESGTTMWLGGERGLNVMRDGDAPVAIKFAGDTPVEGISGILRLTDGDLWINSLSGVLRIPAKEVEYSLKDPSHAMHYELFNYLDGLSGKAPQLRPLPSITHGVGQTLWFTTTNGAVSVDAGNIYRNPLPPPVSISGIIVDGSSMDLGNAMALPKGTQNLQVNYSALSLSMPERVLFRYRLEGYDKGWQDAGVRRQAFYSHLPHGHYVFHVIACNNDGVWNDIGAQLPISLPPTFLQSWYLKLLASVSVLAAFWLFYLLRLRQETSKLRVRLSERFHERERIAQDLHDSFLQGMQALLLHFHNTSRTLPSGDPTRLALEETLHQSDGIMRQGREAVFNLRSQSHNVNDLGSRLEASAMGLAHYGPSIFRLNVTGETVPLNSRVSDELAKLGREALSNAFRHAKAETIEVHIAYSAEALDLTVHDDGIGISAETLAAGGVQNHWGLPGMKERAIRIGASIQILSEPSSGTTIRVSLSSGLAYIKDGRSRNWKHWGGWLGNN
jgi:signal transduction histidine kinase/ligand-binding sensor domain-containing protein